MNDPAGCVGYWLEIWKITPGGSVGQFGDVKVNPLSVPASSGKALKKIGFGRIKSNKKKTSVVMESMK